MKRHILLATVLVGFLGALAPRVVATESDAFFAPYDPRLDTIPEHLVMYFQQYLRGQLADRMSMADLYRDLGTAPLHVMPVSKQTRESYATYEVEIASTPTRSIPLRVTRPIDAKPRSLAAVVAIHGHGHDRSAVYEKDSIYRGFATALADHGYVTVALDVGQHEAYESGRSVMGERLWDAIRAVDYALSLPEVDPARVGCAGLSLGGEMTMWLAAMDPRVKATVSCGFLTFMDQMEQNHCMCWKFPGLRELVDFPDIYGLIAPRPLQCQNGRAEGPTQFPPYLAAQALVRTRDYYGAYGRAQLADLHVHEGGHEVDVEALKAFFIRHLAP